MFGRGFGNGLWNGATVRPTARMGGKQLGQLACCNAPNGQGYCFDSGTGVCVMTWISGSGAPPGSPACVQDAQGQWVHPGCPGVDGPPPGDGDGGRPCLPPGCRYVAAPQNPMQEVICECYNCTTGESRRWQGMLGQFTAMGLKNPCLSTPQWFPKPIQCPPEGEDYVLPPFGGCPPPPDGGPPPPPPPPPPDGEACPAGMIKRDDKCCTPDEYAISTTFDPAQPEGVCVAKHQCFLPPDYTQLVGPPVEGGVDMSFCEAAVLPADYEGGLACPTDGTYDIYDAVTGELIASDVAAGDLPPDAEIVAVDDPRCGPLVAPPGLPPGPLPPPIAPGLPFPSEGAPIPTTPMPGAPQAPTQNPFTTGFVPCGGQPPINVRSLRTETLPSRPDSWQDQWTRI